MGGLNLDGWNTRRPPLGHCPRDVINLKNARTLGHSQAPPLDIVRVTSSALRKIDPPLLDIHKHPPPPSGHCPCDVIHIPSPRGLVVIGRSRSRTLCIGLLKGGTKLLMGGTNSWGWATGGVVRPPPPRPPPLATGLLPYL